MKLPDIKNLSRETLGLPDPDGDLRKKETWIKYLLQYYGSAAPDTPVAKPSAALPPDTIEKVKVPVVPRVSGKTWKDLALASGEMPADNRIYRMVPEGDELLMAMQKDNGNPGTVSYTLRRCCFPSQLDSLPSSLPPHTVSQTCRRQSRHRNLSRGPHPALLPLGHLLLCGQESLWRSLEAGGRG